MKSKFIHSIRSFVFLLLILTQSLFAQTRFGIMINSHISNFEDFYQGSFQEYNKFYPFLSPTFLINFVSESNTISIRPGYYYSNSVKGFQLGGHFMKEFYSNFYASLGFNFIFNSGTIEGNSTENLYSKTFLYGILGIGYSYKKLLFEINYGINLSNRGYGTVTFDEFIKQKTKETKMNNIINIGFGVAL